MSDFDGFLGNIRFRQSISKLFLSYLLCAELVHGQECPTLPCTQSIAVYGLSPPPGIISSPQAAPPDTSTTASSTQSSTTTPLTTHSSTQPFTTTPLTTPSSTTTSSITPTTSTQQSTPTVTNAAQVTTQGSVCAFPCTASVPIYSVAYYTPSPSSSAALSITPNSSTSATPSNTAAQQGTSNGGSTSASSVRAPSAITNATTSSQPTGNVTITTNCGQCSVLAEQVQVYYWPTQSVRSDCARASSLVLQSSVTYGINATKTLSPSGSVGGGLTTDVVDGFTLYGRAKPMMICLLTPNIVHIHLYMSL